MLISIYLSLLGLALVLIILGYYVNIKVLSLVGATAMMLLGLVLSAGTIDYKIGYNETVPCNCTDDAKITQVVDVYDQLDDSTSVWFGRYLAIAGGVAFTLIIISNRGRGARD